jgi:hypothetical protein
VRLPAGWYPDPTGLPQLRWWDNHAWTQHTTAARQPLIAQESRLAWADDLPTRRERRERERDERGPDDVEPTDETLLELAPPSADDEPADEPAPELYRAGADEFDDESEESDYVPLAASGHAGRIPSVPSLGVSEEDQEPRRPHPPVQDVHGATASTPLFDQIAARTLAGAGASQSAGTSESASAERAKSPAVRPELSPAPTGTAPVWIIALLPLLQLVIVLLLVTGLGTTQSTELLMPAILVGLSLATIALAFADFRLLRRSGIDRPAHWTWSLLTAPIYLFVRAMVLTRTTGRGFGPLLVWVALGLLSVGSVLAVPGMLIASAPAAFSAQAEQSIAADAAATGAELEASCPAAPPILVGQSFTCTGRSSNGKSYQVEVSLQRTNGWIDWRVDDWGVNTLSR